ncbi:uncharacterized protein LOC105206457 isoform X2 [Solenopsis invicta]|uniref:uncharacterized protein LOC105206457 isoform X2 n=1 Tax=Solenopsis invicta TaxID=13686 RepID=UPI00193DF05B|nr:uncharacterized protein LOC105206457 isoform X2 [Solenopsis invicta]
MFEVEKLKKRWRNLRDSYKKAKNKMTEYIPSGSEAPLVENKKDGFWYYDQMTFLNDTMISRPSISNVSNTPHVLDSNSNIRAIEIEENKDGDILESSSISNFTSFSEHTKQGHHNIDILLFGIGLETQSQSQSTLFYKLLKQFKPTHKRGILDIKNRN